MIALDARTNQYSCNKYSCCLILINIPLLVLNWEMSRLGFILYDKNTGKRKEIEVY